MSTPPIDIMYPSCIVIHEQNTNERAEIDMAINISNRLPEVPVIWDAERDNIMWAVDRDLALLADETTTLADIVDLSDTTEHVTAIRLGDVLDARLMPIVIAMIEDPSVGYPARDAVTVHVTPGSTDGPWRTNGRVAVTIDVARLQHMAIASDSRADQWGCRLLSVLINAEPIDMVAFLAGAHPRLVAAFAAYVTAQAEALGEPVPYV